jgi:O-antigen ligase
MHIFITLYFLAFILLRHAIEIGMLLIGLFGLICLIVPVMRHQAIQSIGGWREQDTWISLGLTSVFIFKFLSALWSASPELAFKNALWHAHFAVWPLVFIGLVCCKPMHSDALSALSVGLLVVGLWTVFALKFNQATYHTLIFKINSGVLAELVMVCGSLLLVAAAQAAPAQNRWRTYLYILGAIGAFLVLYTTHRRTEWIGFFIVISTLGVWRYRQSVTPLRVVIAVLLLVAAILVLFYLRQERFTTAYREAVQYFALLGKDQSALATSVGARLEMYRLGLAAFADNPFFGMGAGVRPYLLQAYGGLGEVQMPHRHFHSEFLQVLVEGGLVWATIVTATIVYWFKYAVKSMWQSMPQLAMLSFYIVFCYMLAGSVSASLIYGPANGAFVMFTALLWCCIRQNSTRVNMAVLSKH